MESQLDHPKPKNEERDTVNRSSSAHQSWILDPKTGRYRPKNKSEIQEFKDLATKIAAAFLKIGIG